jgi:hypothetical protein
MALAAIKRLAFIPFAALAFASGCSSGDDDSKGCTKDTDCVNGRICESGTCKDPGGILGSGGTDGSTGGTSNGTGGSTGGTSNGAGGTSSASGGTSNGTGGSGAKGGTSSGTGGSGAKGGTSNGTGGSGATGGSSAGASGTGGSSAGAGDACTDTDPVLCPDANDTSVCINGSYETFTCDYFCAAFGFTTGPCEVSTDSSGMDTSGCACADVTDQPCANGVSAYCACVEGSTTPCTDYDRLDYYVQCHLNDPSTQDDTDFLKCLGMQGTTDSTGATTIDCQAAAMACGATPSGTGGASGMAGASGSAGTPSQ